MESVKHDPTSSIGVVWSMENEEGVGTTGVKRVITIHWSNPTRFEYVLLNSVMRVVKDFGLTVRSQDFNLDCSLVVVVRQSESVRLYDTLVKLRGVSVEVV